MVLDLVDDGLVLQDTAVVAEVNGLGLLGQDGDLAASLVVALLEGLEGSSGLTAEAERARDLGPVDLGSGAALFSGKGVSGWFPSRQGVFQCEGKQENIQQPL